MRSAMRSVGLCVGGEVGVDSGTGQDEALARERGVCEGKVADGVWALWMWQGARDDGWDVHWEDGRMFT